MKKQFFALLSVVLCLSMLLSLIGCSPKETVKPDNLKQINKSARLQDGEGVENETFKLYWSAKLKTVVLENKETGTKWSTVSGDLVNLPKEELDGLNNLKLNQLLNFQSAITVRAYSKDIFDNPSDYEVVTLDSTTDSMINDEYSVEIKGNSIVVKFYFKEINAIIPVKYTLKAEGLSVSVSTNEIVESLSPIYYIEVAPMLCSVKNGTEDSYLFYPSGTGALINTSDETVLNGEYIAEVYGADLSRITKNKLTNQKNIYIPVFGAKRGNEALLSVISSGQEQASLKLETNRENQGYGNIAARFAVRGYDYNEIKGLVASDDAAKETQIWSEDKLAGATYTIDFYPLYGDDANYSGMAKKYQSILYGNNNPKSGLKENAFSLKIIGGTMQQENLLGFPYKSLFAATTFAQAQTMVKELSATGVKPNVQLQGFSNAGMDIVKPAGGLDFGGAFGKKADLNALLNYCKQNGIDSFVDFNITQFSSGGSGISSTFDVAKTANGRPATQYYVNKATQYYDLENYASYNMVSRKCVPELAAKLLKRVSKYDISGVSFSTLSDSAYSDYDLPQYYLRNNMGKDTKDIYNSYKNAGKKVAANGTNAYAAVIADCIFDAPLDSAEQDIFWVDVPFYQMVFKGKTEIASESVNAGESMKVKQLKCIETGTSMQYTLYNNYDSVLTYSPYKGIYGAKYSDNKKSILDSAAQYKDYYAAVNGKTIISHELITEKVRATTFSGGTVVYVNYAKTDYTLPDGTVVPSVGYVVK